MAFQRHPPPPFESEALARLEAREQGSKLPRLCFQCGSDVKPPKLNWCSRKCVEDRKAMDPSRRWAVFMRDKGICAHCGTDCSAYDHARGRQPWDADHIVPLVEGGTNDLTNLRTLCIPCHKDETVALNARLRSARVRAVG